MSKLTAKLLLALFIPMSAACSNMRHYEWTEDVQLSGGTLILARRSQDYKLVVDRGAGFQKGWLFQKSTLEADIPSPIGRKVHWEGSLIPLVLDLHADKSLYLVNVVATGASRNEWRVPEHEFYVVFRLKDQGWERIPLAELPQSIQPNLLGAARSLFIDGDARSGIHVDFKTKAKLQSNPLLVEQYKRIVRLPAPTSK